MNRSLAAHVPVGVVALLLGCVGVDPELRSLLGEAQGSGGVRAQHQGPAVEAAATGPARFAATLHQDFDAERAFELVKFIDRFYRAPANEGYDEVLERLAGLLREAGFGSDERLGLEFLKVADVERAWTPVAGELVLKVDGEEPRVLHAFEDSADVDRVMLPINAPSCSLEAEVALRLDDLKKGMVLVTDVSTAQVVARARSRGAVAVISASLHSFNEDKSGAQRHLHAIQFHSQPPGEDMPTAQISPRSLELIEEGVERGAKRGARVKLRLRAEVRIENRPLRTLAATIRGARLPGEAVAMVSHVQEPGACDNATGVAGLFEGARALAAALRAKELAWPDRTLVFLWGDEFRQSESWLASTKLRPVVGISSDMTGQAKETGAIALLERNYDPGALRFLAPDFHTPWGAGQVDPEEIVPNGLAVIARCAMADVSMLEDGGWETSEHPWEGGSDHDIFIQRGIPAVLFWHFTDFAYHTSLDRLQFVDPSEMRRTGVALLSTALAVASAGPEDLDRYLRSLERERVLRVGTAEELEDPELAALWEDWCLGTREWLRNLCLGIDEKIPRAKK
jgi:hypothetical protein